MSKNINGISTTTTSSSGQKRSRLDTFSSDEETEDDAEQVLCDKVRALSDDQYTDLFNTCFSYWGWENKSAMELFFTNSATDPVSPLLRRAVCLSAPKMATTIPTVLC